MKLAEAGFDIVVLEEGPDIPLKTGHGGPCHKRGLLRERESLMHRLLYQEGAGRTTQDGGILVLQGRCLGGGTAVNWSACLPLPTSLFNGGSKTTACRLRALDFVPTFRKLSITSTFITTFATTPRRAGLSKAATSSDLQYKNLRINTHKCRECGSCGTGCPYDSKAASLNGSPTRPAWDKRSPCSRRRCIPMPTPGT